MNDIVQFVLNNQDKITNNRSIIVKFGFINIDNKIIDIRIKKKYINKLFYNLKNSNLNIKSKLHKYRIYRHMNLEYQVYNDNQKCITQSLNHIQVINDDKLSYIIGLNEVINKEVTDFPSQKEYNEIINRNEINLFIDQIFKLTTYIDQSSDNEYVHLTLSVIRQNIFKDKISKGLNRILNFIKESFGEVILEIE